MLRELALPEGGFASAQDADTDGVEGLTFTWTPEEGVPEEFLQPFEHGRFVLRGELPPELKARAVRAARAAAEAAARRQGDRGVERARARGARRGGPPSAPRRLARRGAASRRVPARPALHAGGTPLPHVPRRRREEHRLPRRLRRRRARALRAARRDRRARAGSRSRGGSRCSRSSCSATTSAAASSSRRRTASSSSRARRTSTTTRRRRATRCSRSCCCGSRGSTATTSSSGERVDVFRLLLNGLRRAPSSFGWTLCALDLHFSPPRELAIFGAPDDEVARAALEPWQPNAVVAFGPADGRAAARGQGARRRQADGLRLRELRLPRARDRSRGAHDLISSEPRAFVCPRAPACLCRRRREFELESRRPHERRPARRGQQADDADGEDTPSHCVQRSVASNAT